MPPVVKRCLLANLSYTVLRCERLLYVEQAARLRKRVSFPDLHGLGMPDATVCFRDNVLFGGNALASIGVIRHTTISSDGHCGLQLRLQCVPSACAYFRLAERAER
jgi:hypothetical protein